MSRSKSITDVSAFSEILELQKVQLAGLKSIENPGNPENYENGFDIAATFPASATGLEAGNAFSGTMKRFCTDEILQFSL